MVSIKNINVISLLIIFIIIILRKVNANRCESQLVNVGHMNGITTSSGAFDYIYHYISTNDTYGPRRGFLNQYVRDLFSDAMTNYNNCKIQDPLVWCELNISNFLIHIEHDDKLPNCKRYLSEGGFKNKNDAKKALKHAYFNMTISKKMNVISMGYYYYMFDTFYPCVGGSNAVCPEEFCNSNKGCIEPILKTRYMDRNYDSTSAFEFVYYHMNRRILFGQNKAILRQYINDLFNDALYNYNNCVLQDPITWCEQNTQYHYQNLENYNTMTLCKKYLSTVGFNVQSNGKEALDYAYYEMILSMSKMNKTAKEYYTYMFETFKPCIANSHALSPIQYCDGPNFIPTIDQYKPGSSHAADPVQYYDHNKGLNFTPSVDEYQQVNSSARAQNLHLNLYNDIYVPSAKEFCPGECSTSTTTQLPHDQYQSPVNSSARAQNLYLDLYNNIYVPLTKKSAKGESSTAASTQLPNDEYHSPVNSSARAQNLYLNLYDNIYVPSTKKSAKGESSTAASTQLPYDEYQSPAVQNTEQFPNTTNISIPSSSYTHASDQSPFVDLDYNPALYHD